jgi:photosystem II stability/assembly factor-like uncharacterized protein
MTTCQHVYVGTAGHSAWFSEDAGQTFVHPNSHSGMYLEARVWCMTAHPGQPQRLWAASDMGLFVWDEVPARWQAVPSPMQDVWYVAIDPTNPQHLIAGTRPAALYRSTDGGAHWQQLEVPGLQTFSAINMGATRVTQILFEARDPRRVWACVEIGGIFLSEDGGQTWQARDQGLISADVHGLAVIDRPDGTQRLLATTNRGLHESHDAGASWTFRKLDSPWQYTRAVVPRADHQGVVFLTNGNGPPGDQGRLFRSDDWGDHWHEVTLPGPLNSTVWNVTTHPDDPQSLWTCTNLGQLFRSRDGGAHWERLPHEFGEIRSLLWRPLPAGTRQQPHAITVRPPV